MSNRSQMISLFEEHPPVRRGVSSIFLSAIFHGLGAGVLSFGLIHAPRIREPLLTERFSVRRLDLHSSELNADRPNDRFYPHDVGARRKKGSKNDQDQPDPALPEIENALEANQTLLQPKLRTHTALADAPIPTVVLWTPELAETKVIVAPLPDKPASTETKPSLDAPNQELNPSEHALAASTLDPKIPTPPASTTIPLVAPSDSPLRMAPATTSTSPIEPTPAALLSISDLQVADGTVMLPPVNQVRSAGDKGSVDGSARDAAQQGPDEGADNRVAEIGGAASAAGSETTQHIQLPKDGKFGVIVVGTSLADEYPQTMHIWSDRVAYTAYLHVGLTKNWILQYAQLRSAEAASNGTVGRLEAPWPYDILRPNLVASDLNTEALMVHGVLNEEGQLQSLAVAFPQQFAQAAFVLQALEKWQFRPALQQGKPTAVEVLLIIPDELD